MHCPIKAGKMALKPYIVKALLMCMQFGINKAQQISQWKNAFHLNNTNVTIK